MKCLRFVGAVVGGMVLSASSMAAGLDLAKLAGAEAQPKFKAASEDLAAAMSYKAVTPAAPLGGGLPIPVGFDVGVEVTATELVNKDKYKDMLPSAMDVSYLPLPKIHAHLGVPFGFDFGLSYAGYPGVDISNFGGELRYSFVSGNIAIPAVSLRGTYSKFAAGDVYDITSMGYELTASKGFGIGIVLTPYLGLGQVFSTASSSVKNPLDTTANLFSDEDITQFKWFVGASLKLALFNIGVEVDQTGDAMTYSGKASIRF